MAFGRHSAGTKIGSIQWQPNFSELHVTIGNPTDMDYENLDLSITPDVLVADMGQITHISDLNFWRDNIPTTSFEQFNAQGRQAANFVPVAANTGYRVRGLVFPAKTNAEFVFALATIRMGPPKPPNLLDPDYCVRIAGKMNDTGRDFIVWFASPNHTEAIFDQPPTPKTVRISGSYTSQKLEKRVSMEIPLADVVGNAAAEILSKQKK